MQNGEDPRLAPTAEQMARDHGKDALVLARMLAWSSDDPDYSAFWSGVLALLIDMDEKGRISARRY